MGDIEKLEYWQEQSDIIFQGKCGTLRIAVIKGNSCLSWSGLVDGRFYTSITSLLICAIWLQPIGPHVLPVKVRPRQLIVWPCSYIRHLEGATLQVKARK